MQALSAGAVGIVAKPKVGLKTFLQDSSAEIIHAIKAAAKANMKNVRSHAVAVPVTTKLNADAILAQASHATSQITVVAIGPLPATRRL